MRSLPLRVRLLLSYSVTMLVVFLAIGSFVYLRVQAALDRSIDTSLQQATAVILPHVRRGVVDDPVDALATGASWQVLDPGIRVLDHGGRLDDVPAIASLRLGTYDATDLDSAPAAETRVRVTRAGEDYLVVATSRERRDVAMRQLLVQLLIAGTGAMLLAAFVGERLAYFALRPVESYRRQVASIARGATGVRLDVPPQRDDEVTRLGQTLNDMLAALERAAEHERRFLNEASHELRTPLTLLKSRIQLTRRRPRTVEEHERVLSELDLDVASLVELAQQLLDLGASYPDGVADLGAAAMAVAERHRTAELTGSTVRADVEAAVHGEHWVPMASVTLDRVLTNLVANALAHGLPPVTLIVDGRRGWARLRVTDAGPGMPPALLAAATERFARAPEARSRQGAGLGLSLVERLVAEAGGELRLCYAGHHTRHGTPAPVPCDHTAAMTVTVLLPAADAPG